MEYTKESLAKLVASTKSFNELILLIYGKQDGNSWRKGKNLIEKFGIDTSHYKIPKHTKEMLESVVAECETIAEVCRKLEIKHAGSSHSFIKRRIKQLEVDCSHFKTYRHIPPSSKNLPWQEVLVKKDEGNRRSPAIIRRCLIESGRLYECESENCLVAESWLDIPIKLQIHHVDGDCLNDSPNNLKFLCPNCHSQTNNWCNTNRGN